MKKFTKVFSSALVLLMMVGLLPWCGMTAYASGGATYTIKPYDADYDNINYGTLSTDTGLPYDTMVSTLVRKTGGNGLGSSYNIKSVEITSGSNATLGTATGTPGQNGYDVPVVINAVGKFVLTIKRTSGWDALHIGVNVRNNTDVESVSLDETEINITLGEDAVSLSATVLPAIAEQNVTWASSDTSVATVENGVVTAVAPGTAIITATATNGTDDDTTDDKTATCTVTVVLPSASVTTAPTAKTLTYDKSAQALVAAGTAENGVMQYATSENGPFSPDIPTVTNAGTYNVWYKAKGNEGYNDSDVAGPVEVTIAKADPEVPDVQLSAKVGQTLSELELPDGWAWDAPSTALTEPGDKTFPASVTGNTNYNDKTADLPVAVSFEIENTFGNGGKHTKDKDDSLLFVFEIAGLDADTYPAFVNASEIVTVNGKAITKGTDFTATPGSLKLTLTKEYLDSLDAGDYTVTVKFTLNDVTVEGSSTFTVVAPDEAPVPDTGDNTTTAVIFTALMLFMLSLAAMAFTLYANKRLRQIE